MRYLLMLTLAGALLGQRAETLLQAAVKKETVDGDLASAIGGYKKALAAAKGDRAVAAKALYGMAQCYRKQGDAQARAALERVVREYGDQPVAGQARLQLSALTAETRPGGIRLQKLFDGDEYGCSSVSANGKTLGCALGYTKEAAAYDTATGRFRVLTALQKETPSNRHVGTFAISPDGKWLAFHTYRSGGAMSELLVIPADGSGGTRTVYRHPEGRWIDLHAWTPDGRELLFSVLPAAPGGPVPVMTVPAAGGEARQLRTVPVRPQWLHTAYSPDGKWIAVKQPKGIEIWNAAGEASDVIVTPGPRDTVAGWSPDGKALVVVSTERGQAALAVYPVADGKVTGGPSMVRPAVEEMGRSMGIDAAGTLYLTRHRTVWTQYQGAPGAEPAATGESTGVYRGFGSFSPDGARFASWRFLELDRFGSVTQAELLIRVLANGTDSVRHVKLPFSGARTPGWDAEGKGLLLLTPGEEPRTYRLSRFDLATGHTAPLSTPVLVRHAGVAPVWSSDGRAIYFLGADGRFRRMDTATGDERAIGDPVAPEANVRNWALSPDGKRLAYFGASRAMGEKGSWTETTGRWIQILDLETGARRTVAIPVAPGHGADPLVWTPDGKSLTFTAQDGAPASLWTVPADGAAPARPLGRKFEGAPMHLAYSPDGKTISFSMTARHEEVWTVGNFLGGTK